MNKLTAQIRKIAVLTLVAIAIMTSACGKIVVTGGNGCNVAACTTAPTPMSIQYVP
jgi:hypothetical protein